MFSLSLATTEEDIENIKKIFEEYLISLNFDLKFQHFDNEIANLPGDYVYPLGCIVMALHLRNLIGCVALRKVKNNICEMKRLYVKPRYRKLRIGRTLTEAIILEARKLGYQKMRLDTVPSMKQAQCLYESLGFYDIAPYCYNPIPGTRFMELML